MTLKKYISARKTFADPAVLCLNRLICSMVVERFIVSVTIIQREFSDSHLLHLLTSDGIDGVEGAKDGRASGAVDEEGKAALRLVLQHTLLELLGDHAAPVRQKLKIEFVFILSLGVFCVY